MQTKGELGDEWRSRATDFRIFAENLHDPQGRKKLMQLADDLDLLARDIEARPPPT
jgi:hypothetical protein